MLPTSTVHSMKTRWAVTGKTITTFNACASITTNTRWANTVNCVVNQESWVMMRNALII